MIRNSTGTMKAGKRNFARITSLIFLVMIALSLLLLPMSATAAENTYTVQLIPSSDHVFPGEAFQLYVVVKNDGWPKVKEAEVAALQAKLSYDTEKAVFQRMDVNGGTIGQYDPESGLILGFGNKQTFGEDLDYAVLTMQMSDTAEGDVAFSLSGLVLGDQNGTDLKGELAPDITVTVGSSETAVQYAGNGKGSLGSGTSLDNAVAAGNANQGASSGSTENNAGNGGANASDGGTAAADGSQNADPNTGQADNSWEAASDDGTPKVTADGQTDDSADGTMNTTSDGSDGNSNMLWIILVIAALIAIGATVYLKKGTYSESKTEDEKQVGEMEKDAGDQPDESLFK